MPYVWIGADPANGLDRPVLARLGRAKNGIWVAIASVPVGSGWVQVSEIVNEAPIRRVVTKQVAQALAGGGYEVGGIFGGIAKLAKKAVGSAGMVIKSTVSSKARKELIQDISKTVKDVARTAKKVYEHPIFAGAIGVISAATAPFGGAALGVGYAASRAALKLGEGIVNKDPKALLAAAELGVAAAAGSPAGKQILGEVKNAIGSTLSGVTSEITGGISQAVGGLDLGGALQKGLGGLGVGNLNLGGALSAAGKATGIQIPGNLNLGSALSMAGRATGINVSNPLGGLRLPGFGGGGGGIPVSGAAELRLPPQFAGLGQGLPPRPNLPVVTAPTLTGSYLAPSARWNPPENFDRSQPIEGYGTPLL